MPPSFQRARQPEQKEQRRQHLLRTARSLLERGTPLQALSLNELARQADMAKANVYRYFESREALLLELLQDAWARWFQRLSLAWTVEGAPRTGTLLEIVSALARSLAEEPLLCSLTAALPGVIEQNLSEEAVRAFKTENLGFFDELGHFLSGCCSALSAPAYAGLMRDAAHLVMGLYPCTHPAPAVSRALEAPALAFFRQDFVQELERFLGALAQDLVRRAPEAPEV